MLGGCLNGGLAGTGGTPSVHRGGTCHTQQGFHYWSPPFSTCSYCSSSKISWYHCIASLLKLKNKGELSCHHQVVQCGCADLLWGDRSKKVFLFVCRSSCRSVGERHSKLSEDGTRIGYLYTVGCCPDPDSIHTNSADYHFGQCHKSVHWRQWKRSRWIICMGKILPTSGKSWWVINLKI